MGYISEFFGLNKKAEQMVQSIESPIKGENRMHQLNIPSEFGNNKDLSRFNIQSSRNGSWVYFDNDNLYPNKLTELFYKSPLHNALVNLKADTLFGNGILYDIKASSVTEKIKKSVFETFVENNIKVMLLDYIIHQRLYIKLAFDEDGGLIKMDYIGPEQIRHYYHKNFDTFQIEMVAYAEDWAQQAKPVQYPVYSPASKALEQVLVLNVKTPGSKYYSKPSYISANNDIYMNGDIPLFHKSYLVNSINPSVVITWPGNMTDEEFANLKSSINSNKGAVNNGKIAIIESGNPEFMPKIDTIPTNGSDKMFETISGTNQNNIFTAHRVNPIILAAKEGAMFGNAAELKNAWTIFNNQFYNTQSPIINEFLNQMLKVTKLNGHVELLQTQMEFLSSDNKKETI